MLEIKNVSKSYADRRVLHHIDLRLSHGIYALLGPNGAEMCIRDSSVTAIIHSPAILPHCQSSYHSARILIQRLTVLPL